MVAGFILMMTDLEYQRHRSMPWVSFGITLFAGLTMVTNVPFYSFKDVNFRKSVPFIVVFLIALALALVSIDPPKVLWPIFVLYGLSGYAVYLLAPCEGQAGEHRADRRRTGRPERAPLTVDVRRWRRRLLSFSAYWSPP